MKISKHCDYAIRSMIYLGAQKKSMLIGVGEMAKNLDISVKFLSSILFQLKKAGYIDSKKGPGGGYRLKNASDAVTLYQIVELIDGKMHPYSIQFSRSSTNDSINSVQVVKEFFDEMEKQTAMAMRSFTLKKLTERFLLLREED